VPDSWTVIYLKCVDRTLKVLELVKQDGFKWCIIVVIFMITDLSCMFECHISVLHDIGIYVYRYLLNIN
jgi:hypothetical protein